MKFRPKRFCLIARVKKVYRVSSSELQKEQGGEEALLKRFHLSIRRYSKFYTEI